MVDMMKCPACGKIMKKIDHNPDSYECECGYAMRRLTVEKSKLFVRMTLP